MKKGFTIAIFCLALAACGMIPPKIEFVAHESYDAFLPPYEGDVLVLSAPPQEQAYETIGYLYAYNYRVPLYEDVTVLQDLKSRAARYGGNALLIDNKRLDGKLDLNWYQHKAAYDSPRVSTAAILRLLPAPAKEEDILGQN